MFQIEAPGHFPPTSPIHFKPPRQVCAQEDTVWCKARELKDGSLLLHKLSQWEGAGRINHVQGAFHGDEGPARDEIALSTKQLTALATDPALHL